MALQHFSLLIKKNLGICYRKAEETIRFAKNKVIIYTENTESQLISLLTLFFYLSNLLHSFFQDCTFVRFEVEVVNIIKICKNQLCKFFYIFILLLTIAFLSASFRAERGVYKNVVFNVRLFAFWPAQRWFQMV